VRTVLGTGPFDGKVLGYAAWKKDWKRHHKEVYPSLKVDSLKRVLMERCLSRTSRRRSGTSRPLRMYEGN
jgi:hypothetical protein